MFDCVGSIFGCDSEAYMALYLIKANVYYMPFCSCHLETPIISPIKLNLYLYNYNIC